MNNSIKTYLKRFSTYFIVDSINKSLPFLIMPILAAYLSTSEFGLVSNFSAIIQIAYAFIALNTYTKLSTDYYKSEGKVSSLYTNLTNLNFVMCGFVLLVIVLFNQLIEKAFFLSLEWQVIAVCIAAGMVLMNMCATLLQMRGKPIKYGIVQLGQSFSFFILCILLVVVLQWSWKGRIYASFISYVSVGLIVLFLVFYKKLYQSKLADTKLVYTYFLWGLPLLPHALSFWLKFGADKVIISNYLNLSENGIYSLALSMGSVTSLFSTSFFNTYSPYFYKKLNEFDNTDNIDRKQTIKSRLIKNSYLYLLGNGIVSIIAYFALALIINIFFKGDYLKAIPLLPFTLLTNFIGSFYTIYSGFLFYRGRTKLMGGITFSSALLQVALNFMLIPLLGVYGAIWSGIIVASIISISILLLSLKEYKIKKHIASV